MLAISININTAIATLVVVVMMIMTMISLLNTTIACRQSDNERGAMSRARPRWSATSVIWSDMLLLSGFERGNVFSCKLEVLLCLASNWHEREKDDEDDDFY